MNIIEVHSMFRSIAQQQGMQTVRAILPEDIDIHLNNAIINKVRSIINSNVTDNYSMRLAGGRVANIISPLNSTSVINALRTLYRQYSVSSSRQDYNPEIGGYSRRTPYKFSIPQNIDNNVMLYLSASIYYSDDESYKCRFVDVDELENTFNDYCNAPSDKYPIAILLAGSADNSLTVGVFGDKNRKPVLLEIRYIKLPNKVKYSDNEAERVNPDIPDYLIPEVVNIAVNEYFSSVGSTSQNINQ